VTTIKRVNLDAMHERHRALTPSIAGCYREAAAVCLNRHHSPPIEVTLSDNGTTSRAEVVWVAPDSRTLGAWANETDATEAGAYGCVIASVELLRDLFAVRRAENGTGADYYVGPRGAAKDDLENCLRLEVSGVNEGALREVSGRLLVKVRQVREGNGSLPALAGVIGFSSKTVMVEDVRETR
jgi:hypothetical protein